MKRNEFLKNGAGFLGMALMMPSMLSAATENTEVACTATVTEMEGPFPTLKPATMIKNDITSDRTGIPFTINITINNLKSSCSPLQGAIVDIWQCDKDGYYSEYGNNVFQAADFKAYHFLRGRQVTDASGLVTFKSIFPGWYNGRATHLHVHIYDPSGKSLLVTQIAFPESTNSAVVHVNNAAAYGYTKGMAGYTYNAADGVFSDGVGSETATVTGSVANGYILTHAINVSAVVTDIDDDSAESYFSIGQNYPNPFDIRTVVPVVLKINSDVKIELYNMYGKKVGEHTYPALTQGAHELVLDGFVYYLASGNYICNVHVSNNTGTYKQAKLIAKK